MYYFLRSVSSSGALTRRPLSVSSPRTVEVDSVLLDEPIESDDSAYLPAEADSVLELKVENDVMIDGPVLEGAGVTTEEVVMIGLMETDEMVGPSDELGEAEEMSAEADVVVDLTGEDSEDESVVDLTSTTSSSSTTFVSIERDLLPPGPYLRLSSQDPVIIDQQSPHPLPAAPSFSSINYHNRPPSIPSSEGTGDDDDVILVSTYSPAPSHGATVTCSSPSPMAPQLSRIITCPICMETQKNFTEKGHSLVTTKCGHLFCDHCLKKAISLSRKCPTCSSKLTSKQFHRIYI